MHLEPLFSHNIFSALSKASGKNGLTMVYLLNIEPKKQFLLSEIQLKEYIY